MKLTEIDLLFGITALIILFIILMMVLIYGVFITKKSTLVLNQQKKNALFDQELAISQIEIKEQTLNYIGQELHDDLGQKLSVARLMTTKIPKVGDYEKNEIATEINDLLGDCIQDIRNLSKVFITKQVKHFGFVESLEREIFRIERLELLEVEYHINNHNLEINSEHALILFRIIQECINNIIKHSKSHLLEIKIEEKLDQIEFSIIDNGVGFNYDESKGGSGLKNIKNRAKIINANFEVNSTPNQGTEINIQYKKQLEWQG